MTEFEKIYRTHFNDVYKYILRLSGSESAADEITSETFFRAMHAIDRFRGECSIRVWLCQIARNCFFTWQKRTARIHSIEEEDLTQVPSQEATAEEICIQKDEAARIRAILHTLPDPYREVFMWRVFAELSFREIGQLFGKDANWACVTFHRAKTMIRKKLEEGNS